MLQRDASGPDADPLQIEIQQLLDQQAHWSLIWKAIVENTWFRDQLDKTARRLLRHSPASIQKRDDVTQDVHLLFAQHVQRRGDLGFDPQRGSLRAYLRALTRNFCLQAFGRCRTRQVPVKPLRGKHLADHHWQHERFVDELHEVAMKLAEPARTTVRHFLRGESVAAIARRIDCSQRTVYRHLHQAVERLQREHGLNPASRTNAEKSCQKSDPNDE